MYLVDSLRLPYESDEEIYEIGDPDGVADDRVGKYYGNTWGLLADLLEPSLQAALDQHILNWVVLVEECADPSAGSYARITATSAEVIEEGDTPVVRVADQAVTPAVGSHDGTAVEAEEGVAIAPISVFFDATAENREPVRLETHLVRFDFAEDFTGALVGEASFSSRWEETLSATTEAMARTLNHAMAIDPGCPDACQDDSWAGILVAYDGNGDGMYTPSEIIESEWFGFSGYEPTLDVFDTSGEDEVYWPGHDGEVDSVGTRVAFHAKPASLAP